jgi:predicted transcriptional regulator of viral defense system
MQQLTDIEQRFVAALKAAGASGAAKAVDTTVVADKAGLTKNVAAFALNSLEGKGLAGRTADGKWYAKL